MTRLELLECDRCGKRHVQERNNRQEWPNLSITIDGVPQYSRHSNGVRSGLYCFKCADHILAAIDDSLQPPKETAQ